MDCGLDATGDIDGLRGHLGRDGFAVVENMTSLQDLAFIRAAIHRVMASNTLRVGELGERGGAPQIMEISRVVRAAPELKTSQFYRTARQLSGQLLGAAASHHFDHVIVKPPRSTRETAWHQDNAYYRSRLTVSRRRVHWWLPLHDVGPESGCMVFSQGSHTLGRVPHQPLGPTSDALAAAPPDERRRVDCPLKAGGATVHLPGTLHFTGPNRTDAPRVAFIIQFAVRTLLPELDDPPWAPSWKRETSGGALQGLEPGRVSV
jgi:ectoine hydroxylase-related dioxygenase (phytanoyl-CoA dioxygenase family)